MEGFIPASFKPADLRKCLKSVVAGGRHASFQLTPTQVDRAASRPPPWARPPRPWAT